jgi:hypothetical protein
VTLEEAQGAVENIEQGEAIVGVLRLVCQPLDPSVRDRHLVCDMKVARWCGEGTPSLSPWALRGGRSNLLRQGDARAKPVGVAPRVTIVDADKISDEAAAAVAEVWQTWTERCAW